MSYLRQRIRSFACALKGARSLVASQPHARIHAVATVAVVAAGYFYDLARWEWGLVITAIMAVWIAEGMNTAIENLADAVCPDRHPLIGRAKDIAAAAVLFAAVGAVLIGLLVFLGHKST